MTDRFTWQTGDGSISIALTPAQFMTGAAIPTSILELRKSLEIASQLEGIDRGAMERAIQSAGYTVEENDDHNRARLLHLACLELASICAPEVRKGLIEKSC